MSPSPISSLVLILFVNWKLIVTDSLRRDQFLSRAAKSDTERSAWIWDNVCEGFHKISCWSAGLHYPVFHCVHCLGGSDKEGFVDVHVQTRTVLICEFIQLFSSKMRAKQYQMTCHVIRRMKFSLQWYRPLPTYCYCSELAVPYWAQCWSGLAPYGGWNHLW